MSAAGTELDSVARICRHIIEAYGYKCVNVRLSEKIVELGDKLDLPTQHSTEVERIAKLMTAGNQIRRETKNMAAVATLGIDEVRKQRESIAGDENKVTARICYIFNSLKNPEEIRMLRKVYKDHLLLISVYELRDIRVKNLSRRISSSQGDTDHEKYRAEAEKLIIRDYREDDEYGQNVSDAFAEGDFFLRFSEERMMTEELERLFEICFGYPFHTPRKDEMGMYWAQASAYRSADLSRQVGAAITNSRGELLAAGCNEVPTIGGGLPWPEDQYDPRDHARGYDENTKIRNETVREIVTSLKKAQWMKDNLSSYTDSELISLFEKDETIGFRNMRLRNLIEFGRVVHAEMNAVVEGARKGVSIQGAVMFCTTFPCHMCARHLIAAGLAKVVFIEPYPKSLATDIYDDLIGSSEDAGYIYFQPFRGVAPRFFMRAFQMRRRKDADGRAYSWSRRDASLDEFFSGVTYEHEERFVLYELNKQIESSEAL